MKYLIIMRTYLTMMRINHESVMTESYVRVPDCNVTDLVSQVFSQELREGLSNIFEKKSGKSHCLLNYSVFLI